MGPAHHRDSGVLKGKLIDHFQHFVEVRQQYLVASGFQHQRMRQVVDVFRGAGEVNELGHGVKLGMFGHLFFQVILNRLDIVVGRSFDLLDAPGLVGIEILHN